MYKPSSLSAYHLSYAHYEYTVPCFSRKHYKKYGCIIYVFKIAHIVIYYLYIIHAMTTLKCTIFRLFLLTLIITNICTLNYYDQLLSSSNTSTLILLLSFVVTVCEEERSHALMLSPPS